MAPATAAFADSFPGARLWNLLGVRAVLAESFERIHRSNLIGMGVLPLQFPPGESADSLGLTGHERFTVRGLAGAEPGAYPRTVTVEADDTTFQATVRLDTEREQDCHRHGGIMPYILRSLLDREEQHREEQHREEAP